MSSSKHQQQRKYVDLHYRNLLKRIQSGHFPTDIEDRITAVEVAKVQAVPLGTNDKIILSHHNFNEIESNHLIVAQVVLKFIFEIEHLDLSSPLSIKLKTPKIVEYIAIDKVMPTLVWKYLNRWQLIVGD